MCLVCLQNLAAQPKLNGHYYQELEYLAEYAVHYEFFSDGTFIYESWDDMGEYFGMGQFKVENDSIHFIYQDVPNESKSTKFYKNQSQDTLSSLTVYNALSSGKKISLGYEILAKDVLIDRGESDASGRILFSLKEGQSLKVVAYQYDSKSILNEANQFMIPYEEGFYDYVATMPLMRTTTHYSGHKIESYPFKLYRKGRFFGIKKRGAWIMFEKRE